MAWSLSTWGATKRISSEGNENGQSDGGANSTSAENIAVPPSSSNVGSETSTRINNTTAEANGITATESPAVVVLPEVVAAS